MTSRFVKLLPVFALGGLIGAPAMAQTLPGKHPGYLHALSDLRTARYFLNRQAGDPKVYSGEDVGIQEIDAAISEIKRASIDDGKGQTDHLPEDAREHGSRLARAIETLKSAQRDIDSEEDNPEARQLRHSASEHISRATRAAVQAHAEWLKEMGKH